MLATARQEYEQQQYLAALAVEDALRLSSTVAVARSVQNYQAAAVTLSLETMAALLAEQGIEQAADATVAPAALLTEVQATVGMLANAANSDAVARLVQTLVSDAQRTARAVDVATRPAVTGWVRFLRLPSCSRCAVLAGRVYRYSEGFQRHPKCDCGMTPTDHTTGRDLVTDPLAAFERGQVTGLSAADADAIKAGADIGQVVNARRKKAGLVIGSSVMERAGRLTPQGCLALASDRTQALELLRTNGYIT